MLFLDGTDCGPHFLEVIDPPPIQPMAKSTTPKSIDIELSSTGGSGTQAVDPLEESYDTTKNDDDSMEESQTSSVETLRRAYSASVLSERTQRDC